MLPQRANSFILDKTYFPKGRKTFFRKLFLLKVDQRPQEKSDLDSAVRCIKTVLLSSRVAHYESTPIQIYKKTPPKTENFQIKKLWYFFIFLLGEAVKTSIHNQCFLCRNKKNNLYPCTHLILPWYKKGSSELEANSWKYRSVNWPARYDLNSVDWSANLNSNRTMANIMV